MVLSRPVHVHPNLECLLGRNFGDSRLANITPPKMAYRAAQAPASTPGLAPRIVIAAGHHCQCLAPLIHQPAAATRTHLQPLAQPPHRLHQHFLLLDADLRESYLPGCLYVWEVGRGDWEGSSGCVYYVGHCGSAHHSLETHYADEGTQIIEDGVYSYRGVIVIVDWGVRGGGYHDAEGLLVCL